MNADETISIKRSPIITSGWIGVVVIALVALLWCCWPERHAPFDSTVWKSAHDDRGFEERYAMRKSLLEKFAAGDFVDERSVRSQLGEGDAHLNSSQRRRVYDLGKTHRGLIRFDRDCLMVSFTEDGKIVDYRITLSS